MRFTLLLAAFLCIQSLSAQLPYIRFPNDTFVYNICLGLESYLVPTFYNPDSFPVGMSYDDEVFTVILPDACFQIERHWKVFNTETYDPAKPCIPIPNPRPDVPPYTVANLTGPVLSPINTPGQPWSATETKIFFMDTVSTNYSKFWSDTANCYYYHQWLRINDTVPPTITRCDIDPEIRVDTSANDALIWNDTAFAQIGDLPEAPVDMFVQAFDSCTGYIYSATYTLFLDLDQDGIQETAVPAGSASPRGTVRYGNIDGNYYTSGTLYQFDTRPVPVADRYQFDCKWITDSLGNRMMQAAWSVGAGNNTVFAPVQFPPGNHRIEWEISDACNFPIFCESPIRVDQLVATKNTRKEAPALFCRPNPFRENAQLRFFLPENGAFAWQLYCATGALLAGKIQSGMAGDQVIDIPGNLLGNKPGVYLFSLETQWGRAVERLLFIP